MKNFTLGILGLFCLMSCNPNNTKSKSSTIPELEPLRSDIVVTPEYAILKFNSTVYWLFKNAKPASLNASEIKETELLLSKCINAYNPKQLKRFKKANKENPGYKISKNHYIIDLVRYDRQFIAVINKKDEKEVWVNCFCITSSNKWKKEVFQVNDGENCFFNVKINLTKKTYYNLMVNGDA